MPPYSDELQRLLTAELGPGDNIMWSGQPDPRATMLSNWVTVPFAILWLTITAAIFLDVLNDSHWMGLAFLSILAAIGIYLLIAPFLAYLDARRTIFGISERRLIVIRRNGRSVKSLLLSGVRHVERIRKWWGVTLRIPTSLVSDGDVGQRVDFLDLHGLKDGERPYRLLTADPRPTL